MQLELLALAGLLALPVLLEQPERLDLPDLLALREQRVKPVPLVLLALPERKALRVLMARLV